MMESDEGTAPNYVNIAHRAALLYSFASIVLFELVLRSPFPQSVELLAVAAPVVFFIFATSSYILNGRARLTDNQFRSPPKPGVLRAAMWGLIAAEVGGIAILLTGFVSTSVTEIALAAFGLTILIGLLVLLATLFGQGVLSVVLKAAVRG